MILLDSEARAKLFSRSNSKSVVGGETGLKKTVLIVVAVSVIVLILIVAVVVAFLMTSSARSGTAASSNKTQANGRLSSSFAN